MPLECRKNAEFFKLVHLVFSGLTENFVIKQQNADFYHSCHILQVTSNKLRHCLRPEMTQLYKANHYVAPNEYVENPTSMDFWIRFITDEVEIKEEIPVVGVTTFIGSVGGSLGLFLGFSFYSSVSMLIDIFF